MTIRILLADDQELIRRGFRMILEEQPDITVVGEAADGGAAVRLTRELHPDVVLMDVRMPGTDGIGATRRIVAECPGWCARGTLAAPAKPGPVGGVRPF
jgi:DNA-binding NarL/FixJ family response regulator